MQQIQRGMRGKLNQYVRPDREIEVAMSVNGGAVYDYCCFGVDSAGKLSNDKYMVFYNQTQSPNREIVYTADGNSARFTINLNQLPSSIQKLVFTVSIDGDGTMGDIASHTATIRQGGQDAVSLQLSGSDFHSEKAVISIELYQKDVWRLGAVASGFNGGLGDLLRAYGGEEAMGKAGAPTPPPQPEAAPAKVELRKGQKVNLRKSGSTLGEILINLNWSQPTKRGGLFSPRPAAIDLDLGCLFELKDGRKGCVQALGNAFGSLTEPPFIALDGDDRTGAVAGGENLRVNGAMIREIRRILVYTFIYEGAANWAEAKGVVTVKCPGSQEVIVRMDEYGSNLPMCAIAMLENCNDETFSVEKLIQFFQGHKFMDEAYSWGMRWVAGRK